ncbi:MAG TPA: hypothetical protein VIJ35_07300, partial [Bradyrhizobium sp.]
FPEKLDLILIDGATLLVRARAPPETWTTRLEPLGQPEPALLDHLFRLVTISGNDCSKFEQFAERLEFRHRRLYASRKIGPLTGQEQQRAGKCRPPRSGGRRTLE